MRAVVIAFGKLRTPGLREANDYYLRNLGPWARSQEIELKPLSVSDKSDATRLQIQTKEATLLQEVWNKQLAPPPRRKLVLLTERGKALNSRQWAEQISRWEQEGMQDVAFCIGSSLGFLPALSKEIDAEWSLGPQTLPHELARVVLCEQLYRAWSLTRGHPYHNEG